MNNWNLLLLLIKILVVSVLILLIGFSFPGIEKEIFDKNKAVGCGTVSYGFSSRHDADLEIGKMLFKNNCASCHAKNMVSDMIGPALSRAIERFDYDTIAFGAYLREPIHYLSVSNDERLQELHLKYNKVIKPSFLNLSDEEIVNIIEYIEIF